MDVKPVNCEAVETTHCVVYPTFKKKVVLKKVVSAAGIEWKQKFPCNRGATENTCPHKAWLTAISPLDIGEVQGDLRCGCYSKMGGKGVIVWDIDLSSMPDFGRSPDDYSLIVVAKGTSLKKWAIDLGLNEICNTNWSRVRLMSLKGVGIFTTKASVGVSVFGNDFALSSLQHSFTDWALEKPTRLRSLIKFKEVEAPLIKFWDLCQNKAIKISDLVFLLMDVEESMVIPGVHVWASDGGMASVGKTIQINGASVCTFPGGVERVYQVKKSTQRGEYIGMAQTLMSSSGVCPRIIKSDSANVQWATIFDDKPEWSTPLGPEEKLLRRALTLVTQPTLIIKVSSHCIDADLFQADRAASLPTELVADRGPWPVTEGAVFSKVGDTLDQGYKNFSRACRLESWRCVKNATGVYQPPVSSLAAGKHLKIGASGCFQRDRNMLLFRNGHVDEFIHGECHKCGCVSKYTPRFHVAFECDKGSMLQPLIILNDYVEWIHDSEKFQWSLSIIMDLDDKTAREVLYAVAEGAYYKPFAHFLHLYSKVTTMDPYHHFVDFVQERLISNREGEDRYTQKDTTQESKTCRDRPVTRRKDVPVYKTGCNQPWFYGFSKKIICNQCQKPESLLCIACDPEFRFICDKCHSACQDSDSEGSDSSLNEEEVEDMYAGDYQDNTDDEGAIDWES
eukprot:gene12095-3564_t